MSLFFKRKPRREQLLILERLVVRSLRWSVAGGRVGYGFELVKPAAEKVALNKEPKVERLGGRWRGPPRTSLSAGSGSGSGGCC